MKELFSMDKQLLSLIPHASIQSFSESDFPKFFTFEEMAFFQKNNTPLDHQAPHWTQEEFKEYLLRGEIIRGILDNNELVAIYIFFPKQDELYITEIVVHPKYRGRGLGKYLLKLIEQEAVKRYLKKCSLSVDPFNGGAIGLYFQFGYQIIDYKRAYFGSKYPNTDRFVMEKLLNTSSLLGKETKQIKVDEVDALERTLREGFVGIDLIRSKDLNNKNNLIVFKK